MKTAPSDVIRELDNYIAEQETLLERAKAAREFFKMLSGEAQKKMFVYTIPSRSGGNPHEVTVTDDAITCSCPAGGNGRTCWAVKLITRQIENSNSGDIGKQGWVYDERGDIHRWERRS